MTTINFKTLFLHVVALMLFCTSAQASLDGDEIRIEYHFPDLGEVFETDTVVVGAGPEILCSGIGNGNGEMCDVNYGTDHTTFIDVGSNTINVGWSLRGAFFVANFNGMVFADLDTGADLADVSYQCNDLSGVACVVEVSFENNHPVLGDYIAVNFSGCTPPNLFGNCTPTSLTLTITSGADNDQDGIENSMDNYLNVANAAQIDTDDDGYGNACDGDFNNDCIVNFLDFAAFSGEFLGNNALFDLNNDGVANFLDFASIANSFLLEPGPGLGTCNNF